jgi:hypothetical protein
MTRVGLYSDRDAGQCGSCQVSFGTHSLERVVEPNAHMRYAERFVNRPASTLSGFCRCGYMLTASESRLMVA